MHFTKRKAGVFLTYYVSSISLNQQYLYSSVTVNPKSLEGDSSQL